MASSSSVELQQRVHVMVITMPGKVVASKLRTCKGPPLSGLCIDLVAAVSKVFRARSKEEKAAMWAKVSQEETIGYVLGDHLDHPPLSAGEARTLGNTCRASTGRRSGAEGRREGGTEADGWAAGPVCVSDTASHPVIQCIIYFDAFTHPPYFYLLTSLLLTVVPFVLSSNSCPLRMPANSVERTSAKCCRHFAYAEGCCRSLGDALGHPFQIRGQAYPAALGSLSLAHDDRVLSASHWEKHHRR